MMKNKNHILVCLLVGLVIWALSSCSSKDISSKISVLIVEKYSKEHNVNDFKIDIEDIIGFEWDEFYVFPPWTMPNDIVEELKIKEYSNSYVKDDKRRFIFLKNNKIVYEEDFYIKEQCFDFLETCQEYDFCRFTSSIFTVTKINDEPYFKLHL